MHVNCQNFTSPWVILGIQNLRISEAVLSSLTDCRQYLLSFVTDAQNALSARKIFFFVGHRQWIAEHRRLSASDENHAFDSCSLPVFFLGQYLYWWITDNKRKSIGNFIILRQKLTGNKFKGNIIIKRPNTWRKCLIINSLH